MLSHLFTVLCIEQDPPNLNDLGRVLGDVNTVFVARRRYINDDVAVELVLQRLLAMTVFSVDFQRVMVFPFPFVEHKLHPNAKLPTLALPSAGRLH